jgi:hypothetical protein
VLTAMSPKEIGSLQGGSVPMSSPRQRSGHKQLTKSISYMWPGVCLGLSTAWGWQGWRRWIYADPPNSHSFTRLKTPLSCHWDSTKEMLSPQTMHSPRWPSQSPPRCTALLP